MPISKYKRPKDKAHSGGFFGDFMPDVNVTVRARNAITSGPSRQPNEGASEVS
jgi:hypothetical protein